MTVHWGAPMKRALNRQVWDLRFYGIVVGSRAIGLLVRYYPREKP